MGVLVKEEDALRILLAGLHEVLVALQLGYGVGVHVVDAATPADGEEAAVLMGHLHQLGKQCPAVDVGRRALVAGHVEAPELLGIVPTQEVGVGLEEILEGFQVVVLYVGCNSAELRCL